MLSPLSLCQMKCAQQSSAGEEGQRGKGRGEKEREEGGLWRMRGNKWRARDKN